MTKFYIEVERLDQNGEMLISIGSSVDHQLESGITIGEFKDEYMDMESSLMVSEEMEWDELAEFLISFAPSDFIPNLIKRVVHEREMLSDRLTDIVLEKISQD